MPATNKNLLIVEGKGEQYAIPELMDFHTVWGDKPKDWVVEIKEMNGVKAILKSGTISAASKIPGLRRPRSDRRCRRRVPGAVEAAQAAMQ